MDEYIDPIFFPSRCLDQRLADNPVFRRVILAPMGKAVISVP